MSALLELKPITNQHAFNTARWEELLADPALARLDQRIETDRYARHSGLCPEFPGALEAL